MLDAPHLIKPESNYHIDDKDKSQILAVPFTFSADLSKLKLGSERPKIRTFTCISSLCGQQFVLCCGTILA